MVTIACDCCGKLGDNSDWGNTAWQIVLRFVSGWNPKGDVREIQLCGSCGYKAARLLGFQYDTGKILSLSRQEQIDAVTVYGPHGGGLADIATGGVAGANTPAWHANNPKAPIAGAMLIDKVP